MSSHNKIGSPGIICFAVILLVGLAHAEDKAFRLHLPKKSKPTPVQQYNRDGVAAIDKHDYKKAKELFYKAYLLDPNDPFTLNNLGYVAELEGDVDRAQRFYELAGEENSEAVVDKASNDKVKGKTVASIAGHAEEGGVQLNVMNVQALSLLNKDRAPEADLLLQKALKLDPKNPFTLNNMGYTKEKEGELEAAVSYYSAAAALNSNDPIIVTAKSNWRGKPISEVAADNARKVRQVLQTAETADAKVARLNLQGVSALNRNDRKSARQYFQQAYKLSPDDSFALNNMGYLAELDGDRETADFYYAKAKDSERRNMKVGVATRQDAEGKRLGQVADANGNMVEARIKAEQDIRAQKGGSPVLRRRDNSVVTNERPPAQEEPDQAQPKNDQNTTNEPALKQRPKPNESQDQTVPKL
ncbi:MAG TPA: tetratricopeptide repeat protein [Terriglobales bacterium]